MRNEEGFGPGTLVIEPTQAARHSAPKSNVTSRSHAALSAALPASAKAALRMTKSIKCPRVKPTRTEAALRS
jgi:hypothetical protein